METKTLDISATNYTSSWPIINGSLHDAITSESSISVSDSDPTVGATLKPPLILRRPSPDSGPCEITILFTQQHEIRQVYVRSTARVYEIYYSADEKGENEYLCTVRCGIAVKNEELLQETDGVGSLSTSSTSPNRTTCDGHLPSESGGSTNEDGWVDVKVQKPSMLDARDTSLSMKDEDCMKRDNQDCFEATAEISDADPVLSVTLRLLSIQSGDYIYIDEIYVFADPVVSTDSNPSTNAPKSSSESAMMSLLIPTLLTNFRSKQMQEQSYSAFGERNHQDTGLKSISAIMASNTSQSGSIQGSVLNGASGQMSQPSFPVQGLDSRNNPTLTSESNKFSCSHVEKTLDKLVSRVAKIEDFCLRFEEKLVKPISNMEARLERVERQLESFAKTTFSMTACNRISAPEFSCIESESNSILHEGDDSLGAINSEPIKKAESSPADMSILPSDSYSSLSIQPNNVSSSTTAAQLIPSLVVTAPDFSYVDDEGENDSFEAGKDSQKGSLKKSLSINDALASALAGFLSSASKDTDLVEETTDISSKEEHGSPCLSELFLSDERVVSSVNFDGNNISNKDNIVVPEQEACGAGNGFEETMESFDEYNHLFEEGESEKSLGDSVLNVVNLDQVKTDIDDSSLDRFGEADDDSNLTFIYGSSESSSNDTSVTALGVPAANIDSCPGEETTKECPGILLNILKLQSPAIVDFGIPILDVKFLSQVNFSAKSSLDSLLVDVPDVCSKFSCVDEDNATKFSEQYDLVMIEDADSTTSETPNSQLFCLDNYDSGCVPSNREEGLQESGIQDLGASLI